MAGFEKVLLKTGEGRTEYIKRRLAAGAPASEILAEINSVEMYSGAEGKTWPIGLVYAQKTKAPPAPREAAAEPRSPAVTNEVPQQFEGILTEDDVAAIREEATAKIRKAQRKAAADELLKQTMAELQREADLELRRGRARGDMVDVSINLAPYAASLKLDGETYWHGTTYRVSRNVSKVLLEQMQRSWQHQESISGQKTDFFRQEVFHANGRAHGRDPLTGGIRV